MKGNGKRTLEMGLAMRGTRTETATKANFIEESHMEEEFLFGETGKCMKESFMKD